MESIQKARIFLSAERRASARQERFTHQLAEQVLGAPLNCSRIRVYLCSFVVQIERSA